MLALISFHLLIFVFFKYKLFFVLANEYLGEVRNSNVAVRSVVLLLLPIAPTFIRWWHVKFVRPIALYMYVTFLSLFSLLSLILCLLFTHLHYPLLLLRDTITQSGLSHDDATPSVRMLTSLLLVPLLFHSKNLISVL